MSENDEEEVEEDEEQGIKIKGNLQDKQIHLHLPAKDSNSVESQFGKKLLKSLEKQAKEYNVPFNADSVEDVEGTIILINEMKKRRAEEKVIPERHGGGKGTVPLSMANSPEENDGEYDSYESMIDDLRKYERHGNAEQKKQARLILNKMTQNFLKSEVSASYDKQKKNIEDETRSIIKDIKKMRKEDKIMKLMKKGLSEKEARELVKQNE